MSRVDGTLARKLDFGDLPTAVTSTASRGWTGLRLAKRSGPLIGPDKYHAFERRRRSAQIRARHLLERMERDT